MNAPQPPEEFHPIAGVEAPEVSWRRGEAPPKELREFVRSLSLLGVPMKEIGRRVGDRVGRRVHLPTLYKCFAEDLLPRMKRGGKRFRLVEKPNGWRPIVQGAPFSYADMMAIIQSDLPCEHLARIYGVTGLTVYNLKTGRSKYAAYVRPHFKFIEGSSAEAIVYRARVSADMLISLAKQMRLMTLVAHGLLRKHELLGELEEKHKGKKLVMYRRGENGETEERLMRGAFAIRTARLDGWSEEVPK